MSTISELICGVADDAMYEYIFEVPSKGKEPIHELQMFSYLIKPHHVALALAELRAVCTLLLMRRAGHAFSCLAPVAPPENPKSLLVHDILLRVKSESEILNHPYDPDADYELEHWLECLHLILYQAERRQALELGLYMPREEKNVAAPWPGGK